MPPESHSWPSGPRHRHGLSSDSQNAANEAWGAVGVIGFIIATFLAQRAGVWMYWLVRSDAGGSRSREVAAGAASGLLTTAIGSLLYVAFGVHHWLGGPDESWVASVFMAGCMGIVQAFLFRGRPLRGRSLYRGPVSRSQGGAHHQ